MYLEIDMVNKERRHKRLLRYQKDLKEKRKGRKGGKK